MATPVYNGGRSYRHGGYRHRRWGRTFEPAGTSWLDRVSAWLGSETPLYAGQGQPTAGTVRSGTPVYMPAPSSTGNTGAAITTPQASSSVLVVPQR